MTTEATGNQMGKRYECPECGVTLMCVRGGGGQLTCHGSPMPILATKPLPSSD